jgi:hypothetical protein
MQFISVSVVVFCLCLATSALYEANGKDVVIFRGKRDRFTNVFRCNVSNAVCSDESCADCQCMVDQTFIHTRGQYGKCVPNELIVYATCKLLHIVYCVQRQRHLLIGLYLLYIPNLG